MVSQGLQRAVDSAIEKAYSYGRRAWVEEVKEDKEWRVFSPNSGEVYTVFRYHYAAGDDPGWWQRYGCNCLAGVGGRLACWHRARVYITRGEL